MESVKAVSDIFSPVSGEITEINSALADAPEKINQRSARHRMAGPLKLDDPRKLSTLMDATAYQTYVAEKAKEQSA